MQILHYELGKKLGEGDMGSVYLATNTQNRQSVALKVFHKVNMKAEMDRGAAAEVIEFAAGIKHPQLFPILEVIDTNENGGILAVVMPPAAASIGDFFAQGKRIPPKNVLSVLESVAGFLHFLHQQDIAHGSIKPNNVLLDRQGNAFVTDLAVASLREMGMLPQPTTVQLHYLHVDLMYHSTPESAGDLYALAQLAYHMLTGRLPFSDPRAEVRRVEPIAQENLSAAVFSVILRGMTHRKNLVYPDVLAFVADLKRALHGQAIDSETQRWFEVNVQNPDDDE